jgi:hypothetical protein
MRAPIDTIQAPPFPRGARWINASGPPAPGSVVLVEFWDFCRPNSLRTLPYVKEWYARYREGGFAVVGAHCPGFAPSADAESVRAAVARLRIEHPVLIDDRFELWIDYGNEGWPARYLWDARGMLVHYHYGEGGYAETELEIQTLLGLEREPVPPLRPEDAAGARLAPPSRDRSEPPWSGPYEAGAVWAVVSGSGKLRANGREVEIAGAGAYPLVEHPRHTRGTLELEESPGLVVHGVCFTPGLDA